MSDKGQKRECQGCIGLSDEHTCDGWADFQAMKREKDRCRGCEAKDKRIAELEEHVVACSDTCSFQAKQIERLRAALEHTKANAVLDNDCWFISTSSATLIEAALREDEDGS